MSAHFRRLYGAGPLHLLALTASLLIAGAAVAGWFHNQGSITERILIWFLGAIVGHDLVLVPLYSALDRIAFGARRRAVARPATKPGLASGPAGASGPSPARVPGWVYVRVPALLSGLLALVFFPEILRLGNQTFHAASGMTQDVYLSRFLLTCGVLFAGSGLIYSVGLAQERRRQASAALLARAAREAQEEAADSVTPDSPDR